MTYDFQSLQRASAEHFEAMAVSAAELSRNLQAIVTQAEDYTKNVLESGSAHLGRLLSTRKLERAMELQKDFTQRSYQDFLDQAKKCGILYAELASAAFKPLERGLSASRAGGC